MKQLHAAELLFSKNPYKYWPKDHLDQPLDFRANFEVGLI